MSNQKLIDLIKNSFLKIDFTTRYKKLSSRHNTSKGILTKVDKKVLLDFFEELGYKFTYYPLEKEFVLKDELQPFTFQLNINVRHGSVIEYLGVYYYGEYIKYPESNFAFIYRRLLDDMEAEILAPQISSYDELYNILKETLFIYEDFKKEFLALVQKENDNG